MTSTATSTTSSTLIRRVTSASVIGSVVEWYDFYLYGTAAALVFNRLFFPTFDPLTGTLLAFGTYATGFLVRPIGGVIFGHLGDRIGRKKVLVFTLILMGTATTLMGVLPTYAAVGVLAPILLLALRMIQGAAAGAEYTGAIVLVGEFAPKPRRGLLSSLPGAGISIGIVLAASVFALFSMLPPEQFDAWGWRVPFLLSAIVVIVGLVIRLRVPETPEFEKLVAAQKDSQSPIKTLFKTQPKEFFLALGIRIAENGSAYLLQVFVLTYLVTQVGFTSTVGLVGTLIGAGLCIVLIPVYGALADRIGSRYVYLGGAIIFVAIAFPYFLLLDTGNPVVAAATIALSIALAYGPMCAAQPTLFIDMFDTRVRFSGISLAREFSAPLAGGVAPLIAIALLQVTGGAPWLVATYIAVLGLVTVVCLLLLPKRFGRKTVGAVEAEQKQPVSLAA
ncbi:MFS transporter [Microbacterium sp. NPDC058389]|uniref:MFS transporter n=1 Tax=Microbacterium sp. NPDC058389 TaxID=3346475 RepID=UPI00364F4970